MVVRHRLAGVTDPKVILLLTSPTWGQPSAKQPSPVHPIQELRLGFCCGPPEGEDGPWHRPSYVWLSVAFVRMLQLCRLRRAEQDELAIEVVMFGQEALVLRRQITRPALRPADRAVFAGSSRLMSKVHRGGSSFSPRRCSAGIEISSVAGRVRANTVRANTLRVVAFDLKSFFIVADKDPTEVVATDVFDFLAHQRGGRKVVRLVDGETRLEVGSLASIGVATVELAEVGLPRQMADGVAGLVAQGQRRRPSGTTRADRVTDGDIDGTSPWKAPAGAHDVPAPPDANRDDRATSGDGRGERPQVEWTDPGRPVEGSLGKVHESAPLLEYVVQPGSVCGHQLRVRPVNKLASEPSQEGPGNVLGGEFIP